MEKIKINYTCPECKTVSENEICKSVNIISHPELKEKILSGEFFRWECPKCAKVWTVMHDFLYHDAEKNFMIYLYPGEKLPENITPPDTMGYKLRKVIEYNSLKEKIQIFSDDLNDRVIELCKTLIYRNYTEQTGKKDVKGIFYVETEQGSGNIVFITFTDDPQPKYCTIPKDTYKTIRTSLKRNGLWVEPQEFCAVDILWGFDTMSKNNIFEK